MRILLVLLYLIAVFGLGPTGQVQAAAARGGDTIALQDMTLTVPEGWSLKQDARDDGTLILGFENGAEYFTIYVKNASGLDMRSLFVNGSQVVRDVRSYPRNRFVWNVLETSRTFTAHNTTYYIASFLTEFQGHSYYGYARTANQSRSMDIVNGFLQELR